MSLERKLNYQFKNASLLALALSHPSLPTPKGQHPANNQRLEFLGDAVLGVIVADLLYAMYPQENEGDLAKRHAALVCGEQLVEIARALDLGVYLQMSGSEEDTDGRNTPSNLEDVCEALIGAIYLDGGLEAARGFVLHYWQERAKTTSAPPKDPKTALQEWAQGRGLPLPEYSVLEQSGPSHSPHFTIQVQVQGYAPQQGTGTSKKLAEREAAERMLTTL